MGNLECYSICKLQSCAALPKSSGYDKLNKFFFLLELKKKKKKKVCMTLMTAGSWGELEL